MKKIIKACFMPFFKLAYFFTKHLNQFLRFFSRKSHQFQYLLEWRFLENPEWFNHYLDQFYQWNTTRNSLWVERGVYGVLALLEKKNPKVLELCCGDGFNSYHFYSKLSGSIKALDFDPTAINHAKKYHEVDNIQFSKTDIRSDFPKEKFDNIIWDGAIEHFTEDEIESIMANIKDSLGDDGILSGYTLVERDDGEKHLHQHEYEFKSKEDLLRFLEPHFKYAKVFETIYPERHNLYFYASNKAIPFDNNWDKQVTTASTVH